MCNSINLPVDNGVAYVWNPEDWYSLRSRHRICGLLIGSLPSFPRQNDFSGLPIALSSIEAALLVEKKICELIEIRDLSKSPDENEKRAFAAAENEIIAEQRGCLKRKKIEQLSMKIDIIAAGKKQKMISQGMTNVEADRHEVLQEEINKLQSLSPQHYLTHLPTEHFLNSGKIKVGIDVLKPSVLDEGGRIKYSIFKDLWEMGNRITNGHKFGSDYLVYPGDPVRFHATYMVRCICNKKEQFQPTNLVAFGRLSVAVNKLAILAYCNDNGQISYQTMQWHDSVNG